MPKTSAVVHAEAHTAPTDIDVPDGVLAVVLPILVNVVLLVTGVGLWCGQPWAVSTLAASGLVRRRRSATGAWDMRIWIAATVRCMVGTLACGQTPASCGVWSVIGLA